MSAAEDRALYEECIAKLAVQDVVCTVAAFQGEEDLFDYIHRLIVEEHPRKSLEYHEKRVLFIIRGDHTLTPQTLHTFDCKGLSIGEVDAFESLPVEELATLAIFIAATRAQVLVLCAKFPTLETAKAAAEVA